MSNDSYSVLINLRHWGRITNLIGVCILMTMMSVYAEEKVAGVSPWGAADRIGRLNLITPESRANILARLDARVVYDLSVEFFVGMPSWQGSGEPGYQLFMLHTPRGTVVDDPYYVGDEMNQRISYSSSEISMSAHTGTHIDGLNHFGLHGKIWNGLSADQQVGDRGWRTGGVEAFPPIIARGVLIDVAAAKGLEMLGDGYRITREDLVEALEKQAVDVENGDVALIRTGRMKLFNNAAAYMTNPPGIGLAAARYLVEEKGAMMVGADNLSVETYPSQFKDNISPVHTYLLAEKGAPMLEVVNLEELSKAMVYEFAFIGGSLKLRGAEGSPIRPIAIPIR